MSGGGVLSYKQTGLEVGRVLFLFLRCNKKITADVFVLFYSDTQLTRLLRVWGGRLVSPTNRPRGGPGAVLFLRCNKKRTADVFVFCLLRHAANQAVALSGGGAFSYQQIGHVVGRVLFFFFNVTRKKQQMSSF